MTDQDNRTLLQQGEIQITANVVEDSERLFQQLTTEIVWDDRFRSRKSASFGVPYNYSGVTWPESPFPSVLQSSLESVTEQLGYRPNNCLANFYPDGHSTMGFHFDETTGLVANTGIAVLSLGDQRTITFRNEEDRTQREEYQLPCGSLLLMNPEMQSRWKHAILGTNDPCEGRISLTFRKLLVP